MNDLRLDVLSKLRVLGSHVLGPRVLACDGKVESVRRIDARSSSWDAVQTTRIQSGDERAAVSIKRFAKSTASSSEISTVSFSRSSSAAT